MASRSSSADSGVRWMTSTRSADRGQKPQRPRDVPRRQDEAVGRLPTAPRSGRGARAAGRGKFSNVRNSSTSSSRNVTGAPDRPRAPWKNASSASKASRGESRLGGHVRRRETARSSAPCAAGARAWSPSARRRCTGSPTGPAARATGAAGSVRPVPQPPTSTGIRAGGASSAESTRRSNPGARWSSARPSLGRVRRHRQPDAARWPPSRSLRGSRHRRGATTPMPGSLVSTRSSRCVGLVACRRRR